VLYLEVRETDSTRKTGGRARCENDEPVKIVRIEEEDDFNLLGVEVLKPTGEYLAFVGSLNVNKNILR
jgi:hypothetical protein